ncbi:cytochrome P450 [Polyporus arcularius HHB13444]|uniref:Cytochrome P450 n=1 Tax=Polyporus arcularius HHB13444 TaxID=1314778 RepID=A0A5C3NND5_9APHY|nr:cytochrome P450 [Polyporus arcularius HHB13444]
MPKICDLRRLSAPGLPFAGVALQIPSDKQWLKFHEWIRRYGAIYSDRPDAVIMAGELSQFIGPRACQDLHILSMLEEETHRLMLRFLDDPQNFYRHPREYVPMSTRLDQGKNPDPLVRVVDIAMQGFAKASEPGAFLVDNFPALRYAGGLRRLRGGSWMYDLPYVFVKGEMEAERARTSFTSSYLEEKRMPTPADEELVKAAAASLSHSGFGDPHSYAQTPSSMTAFILAVTQDDVYRGYLIPKGAVVWANIWSMMHDPAVFPDPHEFRPERICPGMFFATNSVFIGIATTLYVFDITKSKDDSGEEIVPEVDFQSFISHPVLFKCQIAPPSEEAAALIRTAVSQA